MSEKNRAGTGWRRLRRTLPQAMIDRFDAEERQRVEAAVREAAANFGARTPPEIVEALGFDPFPPPWAWPVVPLETKCYEAIDPVGWIAEGECNRAAGGGWYDVEADYWWWSANMWPATFNPAYGDS